MPIDTVPIGTVIVLNAWISRAMRALKVVGYVRVSTEDQAGKGVSLSVQREKVEAYSSLYGLDLVEVIADGGESAKSLDRPGLRRALEMLDAGNAGGLVVYKLDRLTRSLSDWCRLVRTYFGADSRAELMSVCEAVDTRTSSGRLALNLMMVVAEWEREAISERTTAALAYQAAIGDRVGGVPLGYHVGEGTARRDKGEGVRLAPNPIERAAVAKIAELAAAGRSLRAIRDALDAAGLPSRSGRRWAVSTLGTLVARLRKAGDGDPIAGLAKLYPDEVT